jgi:hypothetical protein
MNLYVLKIIRKRPVQHLRFIMYVLFYKSEHLPNPHFSLRNSYFSLLLTYIIQVPYASVTRPEQQSTVCKCRDTSQRSRVTFNLMLGYRMEQV